MNTALRWGSFGFVQIPDVFFGQKDIAVRLSSLKFWPPLHCGVIFASCSCGISEVDECPVHSSWREKAQVDNIVERDVITIAGAKHSIRRLVALAFRFYLNYVKEHLDSAMLETCAYRVEFIFTWAHDSKM